MDREQVRPAIRVAVAAPFAQLVGIHGKAAEYADEIELCGAISDAGRVLEQTRRLQPEVLLLSEEFGFDDANILTELNALAPTTRLVMLVGQGAGRQRSFADAVVSVDAVAMELRGAILSAARRVDTDTAPPAHSRAGLQTADDVGEQPDEQRWFEEGQPAPAADSGTAGSADQPAPVAELQGVRAVVPPAQAGWGTAAADPTGPSVQDRARIVLVFSGKGGVGKSVVASNLATALAVSGLRVALVDLNLQYGDAGVLLHLEAHATTIDAVAALATAGELEAGFLDAALATTPEGLRVLLAPRSPEFADLVTAESLGAILTELGLTHDYLVVDSPAHLEERILGVVEVADQVLLITSPNITAVKDTKTTLRLLQSLGIEPERVAVILNQTRTKMLVAADDIAGALRFPLLAILPYEPRMDESIDNGRPLLLSEPRSGFSRQLQLVVEHLGREKAASAARGPHERPVRWRLRGRGR